MTNRKVLAIDLGASSGRVVLGQLRDGQIHTEELHRFANEPVTVGGIMYWDILRIFHEIKVGLLKSKVHGTIDSLAIDTWGVDFGLLDPAGRLLDHPVHYRDRRTAGMMARAFEQIPAAELYRKTGTQLMEINTAFQLMALKERRPWLLDAADTLLPTPSLLSYFLGAGAVTEHSIASTSQLYDPRKCCWSREIIDSLGLPSRIFPEIVPCGTNVGELSPELCEELNMPPCRITAVCSHDTQSAQMAIPTNSEDFLFISSGTWSLVGTESRKPILTEEAYNAELTNEASYGGNTSFMKNIIGLWLVQESRRQWNREGTAYSYDQLEALADGEDSFRSLINPEVPDFMPSGNIPRRIREYCSRTGQPVPASVGAVIRCINESLALKYRMVKEEIEHCTGRTYDHIYVVGGGSQSRLLCQLTADICGVPVTAGPVEATVLGNIGAQLMALGEFEDPGQIRSCIAALPEIHTYEPTKLPGAEGAYERFRRLPADVSSL